ncbi:COMM domain-containing protein 2 [Hydra vulgaris]|uniref:COMM domain-containing protein 2 n=1 Tax=Hydra vulgaris TaxID=6087 RepID=UPI0002B44FA4|nr:COMM domain-containing protein 2-like [Hydra vulgaris]
MFFLNDQQKEQLSLLKQVDEGIAKEFCKIALDFLKEGTNPKKYILAAQKLNIQSDQIRKSVEAIMHVLNESAKLDLDEIDIRDSLKDIDFSEDLLEFFVESYLTNKNDIRNILRDMSIGLPRYTNLEWRFDIVISSRMLKQQTTPEILLKLFTSDSMNMTEAKILKTDPVNLQHLTLVLEEALRDLKSSHCRRIARSIK